MAITAENLAEKYNITRDQVDAYSLDSHLKASQATKDKHLDGSLLHFSLSNIIFS